MAHLIKSRQAKPEPPSMVKRFMRGIGMNVKARVKIFNRSDTMAYIMISDTPLHHITGVGVHDISVNRELLGEFKNQCTFLAPGADRIFEVFTHKIYYSIYFKLPDKSERVHTRDKLHNALKNDINILQRHVLESQEGTIP